MHFVAGPWFAVFETGESDWRDYGQVWLSDGEVSGPGLLQIRIKMEDEHWPEDLAQGSTP